MIDTGHGAMKIIAFEEHYKLRAIHEAARKANDRVLLAYDAMSKSGRLVDDPKTGFPAGIYDLGEGRIAAMDDAGIDVQILSHTVPGTENLEPSLARELSTQANDAMAAAISKYPDRFLGFATLPMRDPAAAVRELERAVRDLHFVGALINGHVNGRYLDDKFFWPVFECAEALGVAWERICTSIPASSIRAIRPSPKSKMPGGHPVFGSLGNTPDFFIRSNTSAYGSFAVIAASYIAGSP